MTGREMQISFITELSHNGDFITYRLSRRSSQSGLIAEESDMPGSDIIFYWINKSIEKFVKTRYSGLNTKEESFEQTQKRTNDLRTLVTEVTLSTSISSIKPNSYQSTLPIDYLITVGEEVDIQFIKNSISTIVREGIKSTTSDQYREEIDNPLSEHVLQYNEARPLRLYQGNIVLLISDGNYSIPTYYLRYIKNPAIVSLTVNCDLTNETHYEIVKSAVLMYLEHTVNNRYSTYSNEVNTME
jgi:hypothetical protein